MGRLRVDGKSRRSEFSRFPPCRHQHTHTRSLSHKRRLAKLYIAAVHLLESPWLGKKEGDDRRQQSVRPSAGDVSKHQVCSARTLGLANFWASSGDEVVFAVRFVCGRDAQEKHQLNYNAGQPSEKLSTIEFGIFMCVPKCGPQIDFCPRAREREKRERENCSPQSLTLRGLLKN